MDDYMNFLKHEWEYVLLDIMKRSTTNRRLHFELWEHLVQAVLHYLTPGADTPATVEANIQKGFQNLLDYAKKLEKHKVDLHVPAHMFSPNLHMCECRLLYQELQRGRSFRDAEFWLERAMQYMKRWGGKHAPGSTIGLSACLREKVYRQAQRFLHKIRVLQGREDEEGGHQSQQGAEGEPLGSQQGGAGDGTRGLVQRTNSGAGQVRTPTTVEDAQPEPERNCQLVGAGYRECPVTGGEQWVRQAVCTMVGELNAGLRGEGSGWCEQDVLDLFSTPPATSGAPAQPPSVPGRVWYFTRAECTQQMMFSVAYKRAEKRNNSWAMDKYYYRNSLSTVNEYAAHIQFWVRLEHPVIPGRFLRVAIARLFPVYPMGGLPNLLHGMGPEPVPAVAAAAAAARTRGRKRPAPQDTAAKRRATGPKPAAAAAAAAAKAAAGEAAAEAAAKGADATATEAAAGGAEAAAAPPPPDGAGPSVPPPHNGGASNRQRRSTRVAKGPAAVPQEQPTQASPPYHRRDKFRTKEAGAGPAEWFAVNGEQLHTLTIFEKARSIIHSADISLSFWAHAVKFANHVRCLLPVSGQPLTPWEAFYGVKPDLSGLRVFGCRVWLHVPDHQRSKLQAKSVEGLFIGYEPGSKAYRVLVNGRETCSKDIVFDELSVLQPTRQQDQPAQPVFLLPLPPSPSTPSEPLSPAAPAEWGNSLQQTSSSSSEDSGSSSSISRPNSSAQRPQSRPLESIGAHQDSSSSDSPPSEQEPGEHVSLTARYEPSSHMWHQQQLELISRLPRPGIGRFSLRSMPLARETVGAQPAAAPAAARPAAPSAAPVAARPAAPAAAPTAARPAAPAAAPPAAPAAVRPSASSAAPTAARPAAPAARPAAAARPGLAQPALRVPLIPTSAATRQAAPAVQPSMPMPPAPDPRPASPEAPAAPVPRRNPSRERHLPERFRDSDLFAMNVSDSLVNDTPTVAEALAGPMADLWIEAMNAELASLHANQTWCLEERPANARVLPTKWVLKVKRDAAGNIEKLKARLVAKGFYQQSGVDVGDVYAPVSKHTTLRTLLAKAAAEDMEIHQLDFETAFLNGKLEPGEVIYVQQPEGFEEGSTNTVCRLQKALYGLRQAPRAWHARLCEELLSMGFKASEADPALFTLQLSTGMVYLLVYVDDCLLCTQQGDTAGLAYVKKQLSSAFKLKDLGEARWFLGMQLTRDRAEGTIKLDQHKFIQELVTANSKSAAHSKPLPMAPAVKLVREGDALDTTLHHYSTCLHPLSSTGWLLKGTADQGLLFGGVSGLQGYSDVDYAGDKDTARSTTGYIFTLNGGAISWSSRLQPTVAMSTAEAEYMAASSAAKEALWLRKLMRDLQLDASCVHLGCDNQAAIQLLHNPMATSRAKHIDVHHHFVRERISRGEVAFHYCHTSSMLADILTKPLAAVQFNMGKQGCGVFS
ncbi:hypothetical protein QJQ45_001421 [Haematococcus lacustris]|nr:hypothetical protein QJQ45_001421 [Haematococcus lacustris]